MDKEDKFVREFRKILREQIFKFIEKDAGSEASLELEPVKSSEVKPTCSLTSQMPSEETPTSISEIEGEEGEITSALHKEWHELVQEAVKEVHATQVYLPTSERRGIADQFGLDHWQEADEMIEQIERAHNIDKEGHLERMQGWKPPENASSLNEIIDAAILFLRDHPHAQHPFPLGLDAVTDYLQRAKKRAG